MQRDNERDSERDEFDDEIDAMSDLNDDYHPTLDSLYEEMGEPTGYLSCGMAYWHPDGLSLAVINATFSPLAPAARRHEGDCPTGESRAHRSEPCEREVRT